MTNSVDSDESRLSEPAVACLRKMVAWKISGNPTLGQQTLDREFGRDVWTEVSSAGLLRSEMYGAHSLTPEAVYVAMGWPL